VLQAHRSPLAGLKTNELQLTKSSAASFVSTYNIAFFGVS
jgi:hypothetical protein